MTAREKLLLNLLGLSALGAGLVWGGQSYFDELNRLDSRFTALQKEAAQIQVRLVQAPVAGGEFQADLVDRFWAPGALPDPLTLARSIKPVLDRWGIAVQEFQVVSSSADEFRLKYTLEAPMAAFLEAFVSLRASDPRLLVRKFASNLREKGLYLIEWEVGYAVLP